MHFNAISFQSNLFIWCYVICYSPTLSLTKTKFKSKFSSNANFLYEISFLINQLNLNSKKRLQKGFRWSIFKSVFCKLCIFYSIYSLIHWWFIHIDDALYNISTKKPPIQCISFDLKVYNQNKLFTYSL